MSSTIIYEIKAQYVDINGTRRFAVQELLGSSNVTTMRQDSRGRVKEVLARRWVVTLLGNERQVMRGACGHASCCGGGAVWRKGPRDDLTPEAYLRLVRSALTKATQWCGEWSVAKGLASNSEVQDILAAAEDVRIDCPQTWKALDKLIPTSRASELASSRLHWD